MRILRKNWLYKIVYLTSFKNPRLLNRTVSTVTGYFMAMKEICKVVIRGSKNLQRVLWTTASCKQGKLYLSCNPVLPHPHAETSLRNSWVCTRACVCVHARACVEGRWTSGSRCLPQLILLEPGSPTELRSTRLAGLKHGDPAVCPSSPGLGGQAHAAPPDLYVNSGDLNSGPRVCSSSFLMKSSLWPQKNLIL